VVARDTVMRQVDDHIFPTAPAQFVCVIRERLSDTFDVIEQTYLAVHELGDPNRHRVRTVPAPPMSKNAFTGSMGSTATRQILPSCLACSRWRAKEAPSKALASSPSHICA